MHTRQGAQQLAPHSNDLQEALLVERVDNRGCQLLADILLYAVEVVEQGIQNSQQAQPLLSYAPAWVIYRGPSCTSCVSEKASKATHKPQRHGHCMSSSQDR